MTEVVTAIRRVTDIMGEISAASSEQSAGVGQVGEAVTQMDQATQQNAALVEEMPAAGIQDTTNAMVERFQLNDVLRLILETMFRALGEGSEGPCGPSRCRSRPRATCLPPCACAVQTP